MKIDWKRKLTSRKFWAAVAGFLTALMTACSLDRLTIEQVTAVVTAGGVLIAYIIGEGMVDKARAEYQGKQSQTKENQQPKEE